MTNANVSSGREVAFVSGAPLADGAAMAQVVEQQALVDGGPTRENEMVVGLGAGDCVPDDPVGRRPSNNKEFCDENN